MAQSQNGAVNDCSKFCCICTHSFQTGQHKLSCLKCRNHAHRTCLEKMSNSKFAEFKKTWQCASCKPDNSTPSSSNQVTGDKAGSNLFDRKHDENNQKVPHENGVVVTLVQNPPLSQQLPRGDIYLHLNVNGIKKKFNDITEFLQTGLNIHVLALTESRLHKKFYETTTAFNVPGFSIFRFDRPFGLRGGGQLVYVNDSLECKTIHFRSPLEYKGLIECNILQIRKQDKPEITVCVIYIPPRDVRGYFLDFFKQLCQFLIHETKMDKNERLIIFGDFNINWLNKRDRNQNAMQETIDRQGLAQMIVDPTRGKKIIDLAFVKEQDKANVVCGAHNLTSSDHKMISVAYTQ